jgi:hypothetical protein
MALKATRVGRHRELDLFILVRRSAEHHLQPLLEMPDLRRSLFCATTYFGGAAPVGTVFFRR